MKNFYNNVNNVQCHGLIMINLIYSVILLHDGSALKISSV